MKDLPKKVHVIGICGVAMSAIAIALKKRGIVVTGSDKGFFPPVSTELEKHGITFYAGWHVEKMIDGGIPDAVMIGAASGSQNLETIYAIEHKIPMYSYPEILGKYFVKENSIICSGTWGKTSSSALLSYILDYAGFDPSYMFGGVSLSHDESAKLTDSKWNVFEGDEYKSSPTDDRAKFFHYRPTHLLLSAVSWDHADLYPTEESYFDVFKQLLIGMPIAGFLVACKDNVGIKKIISSYKGRIISYGSSSNQKISSPNEYLYNNIKQDRGGLEFDIIHGNDQFKIHSPMIGTFQVENLTGCFAMAKEIGIEANRIIEAISKFKGLRRRLERRSDGANNSTGITILDDIAHSPEKVSSLLPTLKEIYEAKNGGKIIIIFEPNSGGRERGSAKKYDNAFKYADIVIIPRLTKLKLATDESEPPMEGD